MAPLHDFRFEKVLILLYLSLLLFVSSRVFVGSAADSFETQNELILGRNGRRKLLELQKAAAQPIKKKTNSTISTVKNQVLKPTSGSPENQTKFIKTTTDTSTKYQTKLLKHTSNSLPKNNTKLIKPITDSNLPTIKTQLKKLNSTPKPSNSTKPTSLPAKKSSYPTTSNSTKPTSLPAKKSSYPTTPNNKTTKPIITTELKSKTPDKKTKTQKPKQPSWVDDEDGDDLVSEFRDLPSRFQETLLPDLERISTTSKVYLTKANKEITDGFKPLVGKKYAPAIASIVSCAFILIPLILVSFIFSRIKVYFSLQKILIFFQIYLSIYFSLLSLSALVTGVEPLRFFYATAQSTYVCIQVLQTLGYVLYLLLLLMYLVLLFSTETGLISKLLGLGQTFVGFAVGLHYYVSVFHRAVLHQPPKSSWKVHSIYATCFLVICLLDMAEKRKKAYLEEGGAEGKES